MRIDSILDASTLTRKNLLPRGTLHCGAMLVLLISPNNLLRAQTAAPPPPAPQSTEEKVQQLTDAVAKAQSQMEAYQQQLLDLRKQLAVLQQQMAAEKGRPAPAPNTEAAAPAPATLDEIREKQSIEESQIATHELTKVETESKYPLQVTGLLLFNGFVNTRQVDTSAAPAYAVMGPGSTGLSIRQTVLGLDARGPRLLGATSHADIRADFFANDAQSNYAAAGLLRLRTAHAALNWSHTEAFFALDRSILNPHEPDSLVALAQPELAWAGNLWTWNPQIGITQNLPLSDSARFRVQAAFIDTSDPTPPGSTAIPAPVTQTERSRWPGMEARIAFLHADSANGLEIGAGGYFSPHRTDEGTRFNAWAGTLDLRLPLSRWVAVTANAYRGQALAGLGAGGYANDYHIYLNYYPLARPLDDVGGWAQLKVLASQRWQWNAGYGIDNPFAKEIDSAIAFPGGLYPTGLERNRSVYANAIFKPRAYLLFSLEYRRFWTIFPGGYPYASDSIGIGAGYKF